MKSYVEVGALLDALSRIIPTVSQEEYDANPDSKEVYAAEKGLDLTAWVLENRMRPMLGFDKNLDPALVWEPVEDDG